MGIMIKTDIDSFNTSNVEFCCKLDNFLNLARNSGISTQSSNVLDHIKDIYRKADHNIVEIQGVEVCADWETLIFDITIANGTTMGLNQKLRILFAHTSNKKWDNMICWEI